MDLVDRSEQIPAYEPLPSYIRTTCRHSEEWIILRKLTDRERGMMLNHDLTHHLWCARCDQPVNRKYKQ